MPLLRISSRTTPVFGLGEIECGIVLYGKGRKGSFRRVREHMGTEGSMAERNSASPPISSSNSSALYVSVELDSGVLGVF